MFCPERVSCASPKLFLAGSHAVLEEAVREVRVAFVVPYHAGGVKQKPTCSAEV